MHLDVEQIQRMLHGELDGPAREAVARHLAECGDCARQLEEADREEKAIFDLLRVVDHEAPRTTAQTLARQARRDAAPWGRKAAGIALALLVTGAVAAALPGSPVRAWLERAGTWFDGSRGAPLPGPEPGQPETGIAVAPGARFVVRFTSEQMKGVVTVSLTGGTEIVARAVGGKATFTMTESSLAIDNRGSTADFLVEIPKDAPDVEIQIAGRGAFLKQGARVTTSLPPDPSGLYQLPLAAGRP